VVLDAELHLRYERGRGELLVTQLAAEDDDLTPPDCFVHDIVEVRDGTLIVAGAYGSTEADLLAFADALRPVAVGEIHWER
jgi:hypothetical protein